MSFKVGDIVKANTTNNAITSGAIYTVESTPASDTCRVQGVSETQYQSRFIKIGDQDGIIIPVEHRLTIAYNGISVKLDMRKNGACAVAMAAIEGIVQEVASTTSNTT